MLLVHIVLILSHSDGFGVNLHQLGQWVLKPSGDGDRASLSHVEGGEFLRSQLAGGIDGGPRLIDNHIPDLLGNFL